MINHQIGQGYRYPNTKQVFILTKVDDWIYRFACGHWCTDSVFIDLINIKTGIQVSEDKQLELFV
jgi:hypothetical protein